MSQTTPTNTGPLTVVLVHGAFADASSWTGVIERLQASGVQVTAPANPLRGLASDSAYLASFLNQIGGPVLAVGHSYAGAVITIAATQASNVVGLVYVAAFAPEEGERLGEDHRGRGLPRDHDLAATDRHGRDPCRGCRRQRNGRTATPVSWSLLEPCGETYAD